MLNALYSILGFLTHRTLEEHSQSRTQSHDTKLYSCKTVLRAIYSSSSSAQCANEKNTRCLRCTPRKQLRRGLSSEHLDSALGFRPLPTATPLTQKPFQSDFALCGMLAAEAELAELAELR
ncbi:hypothetical protein DMENIID0001_058680 [Sergentomyia squamirostris]